MTASQIQTPAIHVQGLEKSYKELEVLRRSDDVAALARTGAHCVQEPPCLRYSYARASGTGAARTTVTRIRLGTIAVHFTCTSGIKGVLSRFLETGQTWAVVDAFMAAAT